MIQGENKIRVAIVDDNIFLAKAIEKKIRNSNSRAEVIFVSEGSKLILEELKNGNKPDIILMDIEMPEIDGIELTKKIKLKWPEVKIIMLTVFDHEQKIFEAIQAGASGYLLKDVSAQSLTNAIAETNAGGASITPSIAFKILKTLQKNPVNLSEKQEDVPRITPREKQVLELLQTGKTYQKISDALDLSEGTIRKHIENIYKKLHAHNKLEALDKAKRFRII
ncbi:response regulator transcription factor [Saprospiraceae bacterium]|nr:response regulator transcription factor [Saprospiraceae bacterium]